MLGVGINEWFAKRYNRVRYVNIFMCIDILYCGLFFNILFMKDVYIMRNKIDNSTIDIIYMIVNNCKCGGITQHSCNCRMPIKKKRFLEHWKMAIEKGFIVNEGLSKYDPFKKENTAGKSGYKIYRTTKKGDDFIIAYDSMVNYINKMNIMLE